MKTLKLREIFIASLLLTLFLFGSILTFLGTEVAQIGTKIENWSTYKARLFLSEKGEK